MINFYMLVGVPGCGKSTWAMNCKEKFNFEIISSDSIRQELFGDAAYQGDNQKVFALMQNRAVKFIEQGKNVCYDSTAINRKTRKGILNTLSNFDNVHKIAVVFAVAENWCKHRNMQRSRQVPEYVIDRMISQFELPFISEGFDEINIIYDSSNNYTNFMTAFEKTYNFDQKSKHHSLNLYDHCVACEDYVLSKNTDFDVTPEICMAALFHDYGKLFTASWDDINNCNHYYHHENVGAYKFLTEIKVPYWINKEETAFYINYHMIPYAMEKMGSKKRISTEQLFSKDKFKWSALNLIHEGDVNAH